eukprot:CAMPEP_0181391020 /NCGR_PEP_ID=MMETSP1106-20121128/25814_1 /TAXON_ID=81844 /ORGANISM="Mantoniella antarctica, Strain SL-175" /LENGTH=53 /DNA_ID=CAMNT_0023512007 /DNA_START=102 /DNA_END=263 /DNA_ORIENTATION=+
MWAADTVVVSSAVQLFRSARSSSTQLANVPLASAMMLTDAASDAALQLVNASL